MKRASFLMFAVFWLGTVLPSTVGAQHAAESQRPIRIMLFGDSLIHGFDDQVGFRYPLWFELQDAGFDVDFVGSRNNVGQVLNQAWYPDYYSTFDRDHQGYFLARADELVGSASSSTSEYRPDVVIVMLGVSDLFYEGLAGVNNVRQNLPDIIDGIRANVPSAPIVVGLHQPWLGLAFHPEQNEHVEYVDELNDAITEVTAEMDSAQSPIHLVDNYSGFDTDTMYDSPGDGIMPNLEGEAWMAGNFFDVLQQLLPTLEMSDSDTFQINAGLNDAWFDPATDGQGFFFIVFPELRKLFLSWFTYDTERPDPSVTAQLGEPGHRWLTALGDYAGNVAELDVTLSRGGVFDDGQPAPVHEQGYGSILIEFAGCNHAILSYEFPQQGLVDVVELERIILDNVPLCESLNEDLQMQ